MSHPELKDSAAHTYKFWRPPQIPFLSVCDLRSKASGIVTGNDTASLDTLFLRSRVNHVFV